MQEIVNVMTTKFQSYAKYKDSAVEWLQNIPSEWMVNRGKFCFKNHKKINSTMSCDNVLSLTMKGVIHRDELGEGGLLPTSYDTFQIFEKNDLVFKLIDLDNYKTSRVGIVPERGIMSSAYIRLQAKGKNIESRYFYWFYYNLYLQGIYNFLGMGVRSTLSPWSLLEVPILIPDKKNQDKIADFLDDKTKKIDQIINKKKKLIRLYDELRISFISKNVTRGIQSNIRLKKTSLIWPDAIPNDWKMCRLRFLAVLNPGKGEVSKIKDKMVSFLPMPLVSEDGRIDLSEEKNINSVFSGYTYFADNDVIVAKITPCFENGKGAVLRGLTNGIAFGSTEFHVMRTEKLDCDYLYYITMSHAFRKIGELEMRGSAGQQRVPVNFVKDFYCAYPDIKEQKKIVASLNKKIGNIDKTIEKTRAHMRKLKEYRASLIYNAVTGKIKI